MENNYSPATESDNSYSVYIHTFPNGKRYVGITYKAPKERWLNGHGYKKQPFMKHAIQKYGWKNVKHEIVASCISHDKAEEMERALIAEYKSSDERFGYNIALGGFHGGKQSEATRAKLSKSHKGVRQSEATRKKISDAQKRFLQTPEGRAAWEKAKAHGLKKAQEARKGFKVSAETRRKMSEAKKGRKQPSETKLKRSIALKEYYSTEEGKAQIAKSHKATEKAHCKRVALIDNNGGLIQVFISVTDAAKQLNVYNANVSKVCYGKLKRTGGYRFCFYTSGIEVSNGK